MLAVIYNTAEAIGEELANRLYKWLKIHREVIGENWYKKMMSERKKFIRERKTADTVIGFTLWIQNMLSNFGILASIGLDGIKIYYINNRINQVATLQLLNACANTLVLQYFRLASQG